VNADADQARAYRRIIWAIALGILVFAALQCAWALSVGNRQLFKDGVDWVYDVILYGIAAVVFGRGQRWEDLSALAIAAVLAVAGLHTLYDLADKIANPRPIDVTALGFSAVSAVVIALVVAGLLFRFRRSDNALIQATWLSSRNDMIRTTAFAAVAFATRSAPLRWPEYALDVFLAALNFHAAWAIWRVTRKERRANATA
jgi:Co/Zn/Cd efflux system component